MGSDGGIFIGDPAQTICGIMGNECDLLSEEVRERPDTSEVYRPHADNAKTAELLHWKPSHSLAQGFQKAIGWVKNNLECNRPEMYTL
jgi:nucleoside-diphosphate-sugar epimerase